MTFRSFRSGKVYIIPCASKWGAGQDGDSFMTLVNSYGKAECYQNLRHLFDKLKHLDLNQAAWKMDDLMWDVRWTE